MSRNASDWRSLIEAQAAYWRDAGVDYDFADEARDWLAESAPAPDRPAIPPKIELPPAKPLGPAAPEVAPVTQSREGWPASLAEFAPWWLAEPSLDAGPAEQRIAPRGQGGATLMLIVAEPEAQDRGTLLSGPDGALFDAIERAMGLGAGEAYRASALPRTTPAADWSAVAGAGMGAVLRHHIELVAPERLLVLSREVVALLAPERFDGDGTGVLVAGGREIPLIAAYPLAHMTARPGYKRIFWKRWLAFAGGH